MEEGHGYVEAFLGVLGCVQIESRHGNSAANHLEIVVGWWGGGVVGRWGGAVWLLVARATMAGHVCACYSIQ